mgnify:FL=1|tara:strand:+ start:1199 stop:1501 length:303 start_codon:yes stop_codon:yes gene_type:complete
MRQIEKDVVGAFVLGEDARKDNTESKGGTLYLHGNKIAKWEDGDLMISNAGWETRTTQSRLNAVISLAKRDAKVFTRDWSMNIERNGNTEVMFAGWYTVN